MTVKFTMKFNYGGSGWSESWYNPAPVPSATSSILQPPFSTLQQARYLLSGARVQFAGWSVTDVANPRSGAAGYYGSTLTPTQANAADNPTAGWLVDVRGVGNQVRNLFLRGIQDADTVQSTVGTDFPIPGGLSDAFSAYRGALTAGGWQLKVVAKKFAAGTQTQAITGLSPNSGGNAIVLIGPAPYAVIPPAAFPPNIIVSGFKKPLGYINGTYIYGSGWFVDAAGKVNLEGKSVATIQALAYTGGAMIRIQVPTYVNVLNATLMFPRTRHIGRPFFGERGRHSRR